MAEYLTATLPAAAAAAFMLESVVLHLLDTISFLSGAFLDHLPCSAGGTGSLADSTARSTQRPSSPATRPGSADAAASEVPPQVGVAAGGAVEVPPEAPGGGGGQRSEGGVAGALCAVTPMDMRTALEASAQANRVVMVEVVKRLLGDAREGGCPDAEMAAAGAGRSLLALPCRPSRPSRPCPAVLVYPLGFAPRVS